MTIKTKGPHMLRALAALAVLVLASRTSGTTTWTTDTTVPTNQATVAKAVCTTGTESAPTLVTEGLDLWALTGCALHAEAAAAMTAGGKLLAYAWNPVTSRWNPISDGSLDVTVSAVQYEAFSGLTVTADIGRIAWVPSGVGQAVTIYIVCTPRRK
jgi:hypothetical protein